MKKIIYATIIISIFLNHAWSYKNSWNEEICKAAAMGSIKDVKTYLNNDTDPNALNKLGSTPLIEAIINDHIDVVEYLLANGADINKFVIRHRVRSDDYNIDAGQPLIFAFIGKNVNINMVKFLVDKGANITDNEIKYSLRSRDQIYDYSSFKYLMTKSVQIKNKNTEDFWNAFIGFYSVNRNRETDKNKCEINEQEILEVAKILINNNIGTSPASLKIALIGASSNGWSHLVEYLLDINTNYSTDNLFYTVRGLMSIQGKNPQPFIRILDAYFKKGMDVNSKQEGITLLHYAHFPALVEYLLDKGADVNARNLYGNTPLHVFWNNESIEIILKKGADVNAKNNSGLVPLMFHLQINADADEIQKKYAFERINILLKYNPDLTIADNDGFTSLHYAAISGYLEAAKLLVKKGASAKIKSIKQKDKYPAGVTPADIAKINNNTQLYNYLKKEK